MKLSQYHMTGEDVKALVKKYMIDTYERFNFVCERAKDMYLYDEKGTAYLDFYGGIAVNSAGNCNEKVVAAIRDQVGDVIHTFNYPYTLPQALLAERICTVLGFEKIFYQNSGTEANEAMIKMARKYGVDNYGPERYHIITARDGFHGRTYGAMSATGQPDNGCQLGFKPMVPGFSYAEFNNLQSFADQITENTIAIMVEPIQGEGGVIPATKEFLEGLRKLCDEHDMLLLFDEVQTGWCRTGTPMAFMGYGVKPDILSMAKAMGGGMPISAIVTSEKIGRTFNRGSHGTTYGGNAVCCAAALAQINELLDRNLADNAVRMGEYFADRLRQLPHVVQVRGKGLLVGMVLDDAKGLDVKHNCFDHQLLVTLIGDRVIRMVPPLILNKEDCDKAVAIIEQSINEAYA